MKPHFRSRLFKALRHWTERPAPTLRERYPQYQIGAGTYGDLTVMGWGEGPTLTLGAYTSIATDVTVLLGGEHRTDWVTTFPFSVLWPAARSIPGHPRTKGNVRIGNDVWIGTQALIVSGVTVGDGAVIASRAVVTRDIPPYAIVAGNPARIVRYRFDPRTIERLLTVKWWEWDERRIETALPGLLSGDIESFLAAAESRMMGH